MAARARNGRALMSFLHGFMRGFALACAPCLT